MPRQNTKMMGLIAAHGYISPVSVLRFDKFDFAAEIVTSYYIDRKLPFTVIIGRDNG